jgi:hypothetical protein
MCCNAIMEKKGKGREEFSLSYRKCKKEKRGKILRMAIIK